jgi:uncharacterized protein (TIGR01777 family)
MPAGNDFLSETVKEWEEAVAQFESLNIRTVKLRIGVVISKKGGAIPKLMKTVKIGLGSAIGNGKQYVPWIHIEDLTEIFHFMIQNNALSGTYNAVSPEHITNKEFMKTLSKTVNKPFFIPNVPAFIMKLIFGEMSIILLEGSRVSSDKIQKAGYHFKLPTLKTALKSDS